MKYKLNIQPESNRLIKLHCCDWSPYICEGMFIPFKPGSGKNNGKRRFCRVGERGGLISDRNAWKDAEYWEYLDKPNAPEPRAVAHDAEEGK